MLEETRGGGDPEYRPCTGKPLLSLDTFFSRFKDMAMQHIVSSCKRDGSRELLKQLNDLNQINNSLASRLKAKSARLEQLRALRARLAVPYSTHLRELPPAAPVSEAVAKLLSTLHKPPEKDTIVAETWIDPVPAPTTTTVLDEEKLPAPVDPSPAADSRTEGTKHSDTKPTKQPTTPAPTTPVDQSSKAAAVVDIKDDEKEEPQIIIAGDPPVAYAYKDGRDQSISGLWDVLVI
eukprot:sb/3469272/